MRAARARRVEVRTRPRRIDRVEQQLAAALDALKEERRKVAHLVAAMKDQHVMHAWELHDLKEEMRALKEGR